MLIDSGQPEDAYNVTQFLREKVTDCRLDMIINTHAHNDHIGGMNSVLNWCDNITYSLDYGYDRSDYAVSASVRNKIKAKSDKYIAVTDALNENNGTIWISNDFYINILDTNGYIEPGVDINGGDDNNASVAFILNYKNDSYYFSGDLGTTGENYLVKSEQLKDVDLMKATHHGAAKGNSNNILNVLNPEIVVVSTAQIDKGDSKNDCKDQIHPTKEALNRFYNHNSKVYCNFTMGTVNVTSKGDKKLTVKGLGVNSPYYMNGKAVSGEDNLEFKYSQFYKKYR